MTFVLPEYSGDALCNVLPSIKARLQGNAPIIDIPKAKKYVIVLIDGLGHNLLDDHALHAERLAAMPRKRLTCGVPSTTAASLVSLGCGHAPGVHGVVGYTFFEPSVDTVVHALTWENGPSDLETFRQVPTMFSELVAAGFHCAAVTLGRFAGSAVTRLGFDGTELFPRPDEDADPAGVAALVADALRGNDVVYCYERLLDYIGHGDGVGSWQWLAQMEFVDDLVAEIAALAGDDVCVLVTGDHGMINVPADERVVIEDDPKLAGFSHIAGEGRFRQIHAEDPSALANAWRSVLGERAEVLLREEAIEAGWFGPTVTDVSRSHIGELVVAMRGSWALMSRAFESEFGLIGMHGSLTPDEMYIPLAMAGGR